MSQLSIQYPTSERKERLTKTLFAKSLITWYEVHKRHLPWRETHDPYKIWLSEVILQQTRVAQGLPYYKSFVKKYPCVEDLANANEEEVMRLWQGLGYYTRARNMHACARMITTQLDAKFPNNYKDLLHLKGVGKYTAAAIASIAFKEPVPVVDGNVYRVLARVFGLEEDIASTQGVKVFSDLAHALVPQEDADLYNQAIMEFGAMHCTPVKPKCLTCIFKEYCIAFHTNKQYTLPFKSKKIKIKHRFFHYLVLQHADKLYMRRRKEGDIWTGLYDFYLIEDDKPREAQQLEDELITLIQRYKVPIQRKNKLYKHLLTHRRLHVHFFYVQATTQLLKEAENLLQQAGISAFSLEETRALPKSILINNFLEETFYA